MYLFCMSFKTFSASWSSSVNTRDWVDHHGCGGMRGTDSYSGCVY